ncbi:hypothetical protein CPIN17260_1114 [Campylobacter pinnipediorum subsp. pinnipediorum]|uniref:hypothetical protein n=1 Tax=Campylobacter pinnipediorum TaxID=1965231 RepID=UPI00084D6491|nr:hypothetical protein [Campylobacter pinnipediorum]AQW81403.1 hypothetical protein CPIN17260_1114 [Campylobacter pinnipediorum subsp. pinnipediorum]
MISSINPIKALIKHKRYTYKELGDKLDYSIEEVKQLEQSSFYNLLLPYRKDIFLYKETLKIEEQIYNDYKEELIKEYGMPF